MFDVEKATAVKAILVARAKEGATINELENDYLELNGEELFSTMATISEKVIKLLYIPGIGVYASENGALIWNVRSEKSHHIISMVNRQKSPRKPHRFAKPNLTRKSYFSSTESVSESVYSIPSTVISDAKSGYQFAKSREGYFYDYQLAGDDFLLQTAKLELGMSDFIPGVRIRQCGFCVSGQTVKDLTRRIYCNQFVSKKIIINIGSVDILHGRPLKEIQQDYLELLSALETRGVEEIGICTLAPLANCNHDRRVCLKIDRLNQFIRGLACYWRFVIDSFNVFVDPNTQNILFDCYQLDPRHVTGSTQPHMLWNKIGRQRYLHVLREAIEQR